MGGVRPRRGGFWARLGLGAFDEPICVFHRLLVVAADARSTTTDV